MLYFKDDKDGYYEFMDDAPKEWYAHLTPCEKQLPPPPSPEEIIKAQILAIEATITQRRFREAMLGIDDGWLANANTEIAVLRGQLP